MIDIYGENEYRKPTITFLLTCAICLGIGYFTQQMFFAVIIAFMNMFIPFKKEFYRLSLYERVGLQKIYITLAVMVLGSTYSWFNNKVLANGTNEFHLLLFTSILLILTFGGIEVIGVVSKKLFGKRDSIMMYLFHLSGFILLFSTFFLEEQRTLLVTTDNGEVLNIFFLYLFMWSITYFKFFKGMKQKSLSFTDRTRDMIYPNWIK